MNTGPDAERRDDDVDARVPQEVQLARLRGQAVGADQRPDRQPEPGQRQGGVRHAAAEPPAAGIVVDEVPARRPDHDHDRRIGHSASVGPDRDPAYTGRNERHRASAGRTRPRPRFLIMHFYELHEGDDDAFADLLLAREDEMEPEEFFELVQSIRRRILDTLRARDPGRGDRRRARARPRLHHDLGRPAHGRGQRLEGRGGELPRRPRGPRVGPRLRLDPGRPAGRRQPPQLTASRRPASGSGSRLAGRGSGPTG